MAKLQTPKELSIQEQTWRQRQTQDYACQGFKSADCVALPDNKSEDTALELLEILNSDREDVREAPQPKNLFVICKRRKPLVAISLTKASFK